MTAAVVVCTTAGREGWVEQCLRSLADVKTPVLVLDQYDWELGKLRWLADHTTLSDVLLLHDSVVVKDPRWVDDVVATPGSVPLCPGFWMYLGKYEMPLVREVGTPIPANKRDAVHYEFQWCRRYATAASQAGTLRAAKFPDLQDGTARAEVQGRTNMVLENDQIVKFKGTWALSMIDD